eukprot:Gb_33687 [translate_table: standard]
MFLNAVDCSGDLKLILKKIANIKWIKKITDEAKEIEMFITNHHIAQAIY